MRKQVSFFAVIVGMGVLLFSGCSTATTSPNTYSAWSLAPDNSYCQFTTSSIDDCDRYYRYLLNVSPTTYIYTDTYTGTVELDTGCITDAVGLTIFMDSNYRDFVTVLIRQDGMYSIMQMKNGVWSTLQAWAANANIDAGYGKKNTISIKYISGPAMQVKFNSGTIPTTFWNSDVMISRGYPGFIVYVSPSGSELFPTVPVLAKYTLSLPFIYPN